MAQPRSLDPCTLKATLKSTINEFHRAELSVDPRPSSLYRLRRIMPQAFPWQISPIQHHEGAEVAKCAKSIIMQPRGYRIKPCPTRWRPSAKCYLQHPYFVRILAKFLHKSLWRVYIQGILEVSLEVRCDAIERFVMNLHLRYGGNRTRAPISQGLRP